MTDKQIPHESAPLAVGSFSVKGRYFLITGGTQGLGYSVAEQLKASGAAGLVLVSRSRDKGEKAVASLQDEACRAWYIPADVSQADEASKLVEKAHDLMQEDGGESRILTGVVNAAANTDRGNLMTTTAEDFDNKMNTNVRAPFLITQAFTRYLTEHQKKNPGLRGSIVNISSVASAGGSPFIMAYSASKAALNVLTQNNAHEVMSKGIRINAINVGHCFTEHEDNLQKNSDPNWLDKNDSNSPMGRILRPIDVAVTVNFLLSDASSMTTASIVSLHPEAMIGVMSRMDDDGTTK